jgi:hypothetical protein
MLEDNILLFEHNRLFKCPVCRWWALGIHHSRDHKSSEELAFATFQVKCTSTGCEWAGELNGKDAYRELKSDITSLA